MEVVGVVGGVLKTVGCWEGAVVDGLLDSSKLSLRILTLYILFVGEG